MIGGSAHAVALAAALCAVAACGDNIGAFDAGPPADARRFSDAALVACGPVEPPDAGGGDAGAGDAGVATCEGEERRLVCDADRGVCVECLDTGDCSADDALGPRCDEGNGTCTCAGDDACVGNDNGPTCHGLVRACTCLLDRDCQEPRTCELEPYLGAGVRTCRDGGTVARSRRAQRLRSGGSAQQRTDLAQPHGGSARTALRLGLHDVRPHGEPHH